MKDTDIDRWVLTFRPAPNDTTPMPIRIRALLKKAKYLALICTKVSGPESIDQAQDQAKE